MPDFFDNWTVQVRKGLLELSILKALAGGERYAYELVKALATVPGLEVPEGTIYPLLSRLRGQGFLSARLQESNEGPARKYYALSSKGRAQLAAMETYFQNVAAAIAGLSDAPSIKNP
ncbi:MAG: PadR family transcriptional regulator [Verrucomicrobiales bacterium]